jgi:hypothetical protein
MTIDEERQKELDELWLDSLLQESLRPEHSGDQRRIQMLLSKADFEEKEAHAAVVGKSSAFVRWLPLAIAASVLIAASCWSLFSPSSQQAYAAIARSLQSTPVAREYSIRILSNSLSGEQLTKTAQLYLDKNNRYAVHRQGWLGLSDIWFGSDGANHWFVPRVGPALQGSEQTLGGWLSRRDSTSPFLYLNTALKRMEKDYDLKMLPEADLGGVDGEGHVVCERVHGDLKSKGKTAGYRSLPIEIDLWADKQSGIARRVVLVWHREPNQVGAIQWTIDLAGYPSLVEKWFEPSGHTRLGQRILSIGKQADLDTLPIANGEQSSDGE